MLRPQHAFAFLWGNARNLQTMRLGLVVSTEIIITNVLIYDVFQLLYQVSTAYAQWRPLRIRVSVLACPNSNKNLFTCSDLRSCQVYVLENCPYVRAVLAESSIKIIIFRIKSSKLEKIHQN